MAGDRSDDFYVGYRDAPPSVRRFVRVVIPAILWVMVVVNAVGLWAMRDPGDGVWDRSATETAKGVLRAEPYPMIVGDDGSVTLLVEAGKFGAQARAAPHGGRVVTAEGFPLTRHGWRMLELVPGSGAIVVSEDRMGTLVVGRPEPVELDGELLDAKCYLGAMKPGDGVGHRACAALCVRGGIPPMLGVRTGEGVELYLVEGPEGGPIPEAWTRLMGVPVRVQGEVRQVGAASVIRARGVDRR